MLNAILRELDSRQNELPDRDISSIYFGGGTPSVLEPAELEMILDGLHKYFHIDSNIEITLETNPDDLQVEKISAFHEMGVNRLSIGIQSFFDEHLTWMNRAHNADEALACIDLSRKAGIDILTCDLIFGIPEMTMDQWVKNLKTLADFDIDHWSCYNLTLEPNTALAHQVLKGQSKDVDNQASAEQFLYLMEFAESKDMEHYEISNFAKKGKYAVHNTNYWKGVPYLGLGPAAHSFDGKTRRWNVSNNNTYIKSINEGQLKFEEELLSSQTQYNEFVMTGLRTKWGCAEADAGKYGPELLTYFQGKASEQLEAGNVQEISPGVFTLTKDGKLIADRVAMEFFRV